MRMIPVLGAVALIGLLGACSGTQEVRGFNTANYESCNDTATICTGWIGADEFPGGNPEPVGHRIVQADSAGDEVAMDFVPGEPIVDGNIEDMY
jgi:hypothetical protein